MATIDRAMNTEDPLRPILALLAPGTPLREGLERILRGRTGALIVLGYDRNDKTAQAFREAGFEVITAAEVLARFERDESSPESIENTFIMLPSAELSRARGGSHCMSLPLLRENV